MSSNNKVLVYADWHTLDAPTIMGELKMEQIIPKEPLI